MVLTEEQKTAIDLFQQRKSLKISAFAGAGKTSTLAAISKSTSRSGVYLAFNRNIAAEAGSKFSRNVDCRTTHSLALRSLPQKFRENQAKVFYGLQGNRVAQLLDLQQLAIGPVLLKPRSLGYIAAKTIQRYCQSANVEITRDHVPLSGKLQLLESSHRDEFASYLVQLATHLWDRMQDPSDDAPLGHDGYLKLWSLKCPEMKYDFILLDEAQDTNEAVLSVLTQQSAQLILVGDRHQQIYEWRGATNAMSKVATEAESSLTQSFRFGPEIADIANKVLIDLQEEKRIRGNPAISSKVSTQGRTQTALCRTNVGVIEVTLDSLQRNLRPHVVGGTDELVRMLDDVTKLKKGIPAETPELFGFASWGEVVDFSDSDEGDSLRTFVSIVKQNGELDLIRSLKSVVNNESSADLIISTGHKSKGREWSSVKLHTDFEPKKHAQADPSETVMREEEARLLYVAITRPQQHLVVPSRLASAWGITSANQSNIGRPRPVNLSQQPSGSASVKSRAGIPELPSIAKVVPVQVPKVERKTSDTLLQVKSTSDSSQVTTESRSPTSPAPIPSASPKPVGLLASLFRKLFG